MRTVSQALNTAVAEGLVATNHAAATVVPRPLGQPAEVPIITPATARAIFAASEARDPWEAVVALALGAGLRREELLALRWSDVDFDSRELRVRRTLTYAEGGSHLRNEAKSVAGMRTVDLPTMSLSALSRYRDRQDIRRSYLRGAWEDLDIVIDNGKGGMWEPTRLSRMWRKFAKLSGFPEIRLHGLRHGYATLGLAAGVQGEVMVAMMGHADTRILKRYQGVIPALKRGAADQLNRLFQEAG
jgi:integrase